MEADNTIWCATAGLLFPLPKNGNILHVEMAASNTSYALYFDSEEKALDAMDGIKNRMGGHYEGRYSVDLTARGCERSYAEVMGTSEWGSSMTPEIHPS